MDLIKTITLVQDMEKRLIKTSNDLKSIEAAIGFIVMTMQNELSVQKKEEDEIINKKITEYIKVLLKKENEKNILELEKRIDKQSFIMKGILDSKMDK